MTFIEWFQSILNIIPTLTTQATNITNNLMNNYVFLLVFYISLSSLIFIFLFDIVKIIMNLLNTKKKVNNNEVE